MTAIAITYKTSPLKELLYTPIGIIEDIGEYTLNLKTNLKKIAYGIYDTIKNSEQHLEKLSQERIEYDSAMRMYENWNPEANGYTPLRTLPKEPENLVPFPNTNYDTLEKKLRKVA